MKFKETTLTGAFLVSQDRISDARGFFARAWCRDEFAKYGLNPNMLQANTGFSNKAGTLRGMHYQDAPHAEAKFIRCTRGAIFDVIIDLRPGSPTLGMWVGVELTADNGAMLYAPEGFAHGYQTLVDNTEIYYMTSAKYTSDATRGVRYDDPELRIAWPLPVSVISEADRNWGGFCNTGRLV